MKHDWQYYEERGKNWVACRRCGAITAPVAPDDYAKPKECPGESPVRRLFAGHLRDLADATARRGRGCTMKLGLVPSMSRGCTTGGDQEGGA